MTALTALLAVVAIVAIWLSDCVPGFGIGGGVEPGEGEADQAQSKSEPTKPDAQPPKPTEPQPSEATPTEPAPIKLTIDARGCSLNGAAPIECAKLCDDLTPFAGADSVVIDGKDGPHAWVVDAMDCLEGQKLKVAINRE